jgi:hypothetical protein
MKGAFAGIHQAGSASPMVWNIHSNGNKYFYIFTWLSFRATGFDIPH